MKSKNKQCYLLLYLGAGSGYEKDGFSKKPDIVLIKKTRELSNFLQVKLWIAPLIHKPRHQNHYRFFLRFKHYKANDKLAQKVAESIIFSVDFIYTLLWSRDKEILFFSFPKEKITIKQIINYEETLPPWERQSIYPKSDIGTATFIPDHTLAMGLRLAKVTFKNKNVLQALSFIYHASNGFFIEQVDIGAALEDGNNPARNALEQSRWETSLQNYFKAIESIIGDPSKNDKKFFEKLQTLGIDPNYIVGLRIENRSLNKYVK